jgi:hypothetical protein
LPEIVPQHQELLIDLHALSLLPELGKQLAHLAASSDVEAERLREILLRVA